MWVLIPLLVSLWTLVALWNPLVTLSPSCQRKSASVFGGLWQCWGAEGAALCPTLSVVMLCMLQGAALRSSGRFHRDKQLEGKVSWLWIYQQCQQIADCQHRGLWELR